MVGSVEQQISDTQMDNITYVGMYACVCALGLYQLRIELMKRQIGMHACVVV